MSSLNIKAFKKLIDQLSHLADKSIKYAPFHQSDGSIKCPHCKKKIVKAHQIGSGNINDVVNERNRAVACIECGGIVIVG